jgi:hypothetical protein
MRDLPRDKPREIRAQARRKRTTAAAEPSRRPWFFDCSVVTPSPPRIRFQPHRLYAREELSNADPASPAKIMIHVSSPFEPLAIEPLSIPPYCRAFSEKSIKKKAQYQAVLPAEHARKLKKESVLRILSKEPSEHNVVI